jgi:two-component sensor histidine kinase
VGLPWLTGLTWRLRSQVRAQAVRQAAQEHERRRDQEKADRDRERLTLAEALHDDLGHALSLVALNLGRLELDDTLPSTARQTVEAAREQLTGAVGRLGASVRMLRSGQVRDLPAEDDADLRTLVSTARAAGAEVTLIGTAAPGVDTASMARVVREALTNAAKHAPGAPVTVALAPRAGGDTGVIVTNPSAGRGAPSGIGAGSGLRAMSDHLGVRGGSLVVGQEAGVFRLEAAVPVRPREPRVAVGSPGSPPTSVRRRTLLLATGLGVCGVVVLGGLEAFTRAETHRALLPAEDYARITRDMPRDHAEAVLPDHELFPAPTAPDGTDCHDYAVTADWLADSSGDVYRVCFRQDRVSSATLLEGHERR